MMVGATSLPSFFVKKEIKKKIVFKKEIDCNNRKKANILLYKRFSFASSYKNLSIFVKSRRKLHTQNYSMEYLETNSDGLSVAKTQSPSLGLAGS